MLAYSVKETAPERERESKRVGQWEALKFAPFHLFIGQAKWLRSY